MQYQIGPVTIRHTGLPVDQIRRSGQTDYASKPVFGREPPLEHVGEGANTLTLSGTMLPKKIGGLGQVAVLDVMRENALPVFVLRGDLIPLGWYRITDLTTAETLLDADGVGKVNAVTVNMTRAGRPGVEQMFSLIAGLFA